MKLVSYERTGSKHVGALDSKQALVHEVRAPSSYTGAPHDWDAVELIRLMVTTNWKPQPSTTGVAMSEVRLLAPIHRPRRNLWCVGRNYRAHAAELLGSVFKANDNDIAAWPIVSTKTPETVVGPFDDMDLAGDVTESVDYEAELAVIIGRGGKNIAKADAMSHVFGYTIVNDVTARDIQMRHQQWDLGKSLDTFCPMGPYLVTADEFDGARTQVKCWVNDELRQEGLTQNLIFDIPTLIETISRGITLMPGDVIATGTPAGVGMGMQPPRYLRVGDVVRIEVEGLGSIENRFV